MSIRPIGRKMPRQTAAQSVYRQCSARHVHALLDMGYRRMTPGMFQCHEETAITGELINEMNAAIQAPGAPAWAWHYTVKDDHPINTGGREGRQRRRVDIIFEQTRPGPHPRFYFEAKRLHNTSSVGEYLGQDGLGCFFAGADAYAQEHREAGMLGYVQTENEADWADRIQARLEKTPSQYCVRPGSKWQSAPMNPALPHTYRTEHDRQVPRQPLTLYHVLLRFC